MNKELLTKYVNDGLALHEIAELTGKKWQLVYYYITKYGLQGVAEKKRGKRTTAAGDSRISSQLKERHEMGLMPKNPNGYGGNCKVRGKWIPEEECKNELSWYLDQDLVLRIIAELMGVDNKTITNWLTRFNLHKGLRSGNRSHRWKGGHVKYRGADWNKQRELTLERDGFKCTQCSKTNDEHIAEYGFGLSVHHIVPFSETKNNGLDNLTSLCNPCHSKEHGGWYLRKKKQESNL